MVWSNGSCPDPLGLTTLAVTEAALAIWKWKKHINFAYILSFPREGPVACYVEVTGVLRWLHM